jgi:transcriptional regulator
MTQTEIMLFSQLQNKPSLLEKVLKLKLAGNTHQEIAETLGYSKSYIDNIHSIAKRQYQAIK